MNTALIIIDVQNDYFPGGRMELDESAVAGERIAHLLGHFRSKEMPVIYIQHISVRPGATFFLPETEGAEIHESVRPVDGERIFIKNFPNSFRNTGLDEYLKGIGISRLVVTGMMTHLCVDTTVRAAFDLGYECILAGDCCATRDLRIEDHRVTAEQVHYSFLASLHGIFSTVTDSGRVMALLDGK